jgi:hypothetical protein
MVRSFGWYEWAVGAVTCVYDDNGDRVESVPLNFTEC